MPVWNGASYVAAAVESILLQTFSEFEFIIVDDGSTDSTPRILDSFAEHRIRRYRLEHAGIVAALNFGVRQSRAEWIARQDADDVSRPRRLEVQWHAVQNKNNITLSYSDFDVMDHDNLGVEKAHLPRTKALLAMKLCFECPIAHSTVLFRKSSFLCAGGYRTEERHAEDYALWSRLLNIGDIGVINERLLMLRVHAASVSHREATTQTRLTDSIGYQNCRRFLRVNRSDAARAYSILRQHAKDRRVAEWMWFVCHCIPRSRWRSLELHLWLFSQTVRTLANIRRLWQQRVQR